MLLRCSVRLKNPLNFRSVLANFCLLYTFYRDWQNIVWCASLSRPTTGYIAVLSLSFFFFPSKRTCLLLYMKMPSTLSSDLITPREETRAWMRCSLLVVAVAVAVIAFSTFCRCFVAGTLWGRGKYFVLQKFPFVLLNFIRVQIRLSTHLTSHIYSIGCRFQFSSGHSCPCFCLSD